MGNNCKINEHHNIPRSRGGSHKDINLTKIPANRHDDYHEWAENMTPCLIMRLIAITSIGVDGKSIPPSDIQNLFKILMRRDWNLLYYPDGVRSVIDPRAIRYARKIAENSIEHLKKERRAIQIALRTLELANPIRNPNSFLKTGLNFFGTEKPNLAIRSMCVERYDDILCWIRPMVDETRTAIKDSMKQASFQEVGHIDKHRLREILKNQLEYYVNRHIKEWEEELLPPENGEGDEDEGL